MNIFSRLFDLVVKIKEIIRIKLLIKFKLRETLLLGVKLNLAIVFILFMYLLVLLKNYQTALVKKAKKAVLTPLEKTYLTGYLNPAYHYATEPRKRK